MEQIATKVLDHVRTGQHGRAAMTAVVITEEAQLLGQAGDLRVPHCQRQAEGMREDEHRRAGLPFRAVVDVNRCWCGHTPCVSCPSPRDAWRSSAANPESESDSALCRR